MISSLKSVLDNSIIVKHANNKIEFVEDDATARLKKVEFSVTKFLKGAGGLLRNAVVIEGDSSVSPNLSRFTFYLDQACNDVTRQCDYIVFHEYNNCLRVILCELKSSDTSAEESARIHKQFQFSQVFSEYLTRVAESYCGINHRTPSTTNVSFYKVAFVRVPNVATPLPLGKPPVAACGINSSNSKNGIKSLFLHTDGNGVARLSWQAFMQNI